MRGISRRIGATAPECRGAQARLRQPSSPIILANVPSPIAARIHSPSARFSSSDAASTPSGASTFVSSYFRLEPGAVASYLDRHGLSYKDTPTHYVIRSCLLCPKPHGDKPDNLFKLYVRKADGAYFCHRCGARGSWYDLKGKLGDITVPTSASSVLGASAGASSQISSSSLTTVSSALGTGLTSLGVGQNAVSGGRSASSIISSGAQRPVSNATPYDPSHGLDLTLSGVIAARDALLGAIPSSSDAASESNSKGSSSSSIVAASKFPNVYRYLTETRGLEPAVLKEYCVGAALKEWASSINPNPAGSSSSSSSATQQQHECVLFPWITRSDTLPSASAGNVPPDSGAATAAFGLNTNPALISAAFGGPASPSAAAAAADLSLDSNPSAFSLARVKLRSISDKSKMALLPRGGGWGLFGYHIVPPSATSVVLTEGEFDAMSVRQATGAYAVSLPNGCRSLPVEVLPLLERFSRLYLWLDDDGPGREGAERMAQKLGLGRCYIVRPTAELILPRVPPPASSSINSDAPANDAATSSSVEPATVTGSPSAPAATSQKQQQQLPKDANEALLRGLDLNPILSAAAPKRHDAVMSAGELRSQVLREVAAALGLPSDDGADVSGGKRRRGWSAAGVPYRSLPGLQRLLKGHRLGEVTIVTGPTGCGKTTLLAQLSLDLAAQGVNTLWGSFEIKAPRLLATMASQLRSGRIQLDPALAAELDISSPQPFLPGAPSGAASGGADIIIDPEAGSADVGGDISSSGSSSTTLSPAQAAAAAAVMRQFEAATDALSALPLHVLRFFGSTDVDRVVDALEYAAYAHDIQHVILDNLQFMMSGATGGARGWDRFELQERALDRFRAFATRHDVHVTLVVHPRKEPEDEALSLTSVFGSAKATQEADTVIILQRESGRAQALQALQLQQQMAQLQGGGGGGGRGYNNSGGGGGYNRSQSSYGSNGNGGPSAYAAALAAAEAIPPRKYLDVRKNRYDGSLGKVQLAFDPGSKCFYEPVLEGGGPTAAGQHPQQGLRPTGSGGSGSGASVRPSISGSSPQSQQQPYRQLNSLSGPAQAIAAAAASSSFSAHRQPPSVVIQKEYGSSSSPASPAASRPPAPTVQIERDYSVPAGLTPAMDGSLLISMAQQYDSKAASAASAAVSAASKPALGGGAGSKRGYHTSAAVTAAGSSHGPRVPETPEAAAARRAYWAKRSSMERQQQQKTQAQGQGAAASPPAPARKSGPYPYRSSSSSGGGSGYSGYYRRGGYGSPGFAFARPPAFLASEIDAALQRHILTVGTEAAAPLLVPLEEKPAANLPTGIADAISGESSAVAVSGDATASANVSPSDAVVSDEAMRAAVAAALAEAAAAEEATAWHTNGCCWDNSCSRSEAEGAAAAAGSSSASIN